MFGRSKHGWIGLDIGASCIKLAQVARRAGRLELVDATIVPRAEPWRDADLVAVPPISAAEEISAAVITAPEATGRHSAAMLSPTTCQLNMAPYIKDGGPSQISAIVDELAAVGVSLTDRVFDYWPALGSKSGQSGVHVLSTSRGWSETTTTDLQRAGLTCASIDGLPHALARAVNFVQADANNTIAALDWSYTGATFVLVDHAQPAYVRQLRNCQLAEVIDHVAEQLSLDTVEAGELLQKVDLTPRMVGPRDEVAEFVRELVEPMVNNLVDELQRTLEHLHNLGKQMTPKRLFLAPQLVYLFGGGATIGGIDLLLSQRLHRQVLPWKLSDDAEAVATSRGTPLAMLGPAIALSALCWEDVA